MEDKTIRHRSNACKVNDLILLIHEIEICNNHLNLRIGQIE